ncbi:MAG TPA: DUF6328 family protein [Actinomycetes bacterium]|nr:DUF6328 family protein [Actinomycetes bacterium]
MNAKSAPNDGRDESSIERTDRNFTELLQELRVAQTGVQILFAFLLTMPFTQRFVTLDQTQKWLYGVTVLTAAMALGLLVGPVAAHRLTFRTQRKESVLMLSHVMTLAGMCFMGLAVTLAVSLAIWAALGGTAAVLATVTVAVTFVTFWLALPLWVRHKTPTPQ